MRKITKITLITLICFIMFGCTKNEPYVVHTYETTASETVEEYLENNKLVTMVPYYEMSDGTWKTNHYTYQYRLEITGRMNCADTL